MVKWIQMALQLTTSCKILPSRIKGLSAVSNHRFAFMKHNGWWFLDDFGSVLNAFGTFDQASAHECTTSLPGPLSHSDGLTTLQVPEALHEGSIQKATTHLRSMGPVKWLNIQQLLMVSHKPYKPPSSPSSSDLKGTLSHFSFFFRSDEHNILGEVKSHRTPPKKWVPKQKKSWPTIPKWVPFIFWEIHFASFQTSYWLTYPNLLGPHGAPCLAAHRYHVCLFVFFGRFGAEVGGLVLKWVLLSQVDPGSPEFGCRWISKYFRFRWATKFCRFQACDNWLGYNIRSYQ